MLYPTISNIDVTIIILSVKKSRIILKTAFVFGLNISDIGFFYQKDG
jgi:hypothetical protein